MSVKKILLFGAAAMTAIAASSTIAADSASVLSSESMAPVFQNSVYLDFHGGYAQVDWRDFNASGLMGLSGKSYFMPNKNRNGGFSGGVDTGYTLTKHIAAEFGWFCLPQVRGEHSGVTSPRFLGASLTTTAKANSWVAYGAAKFTVPVMTDVDLFGKAGVAYRALSYSAPQTPAMLVEATKDGHYWAPMFATGMQITKANWLMGVQYLYVAGHSSRNTALVSSLAGYGAPNAAPAVNMYTAFVGYEFPA